jgi:hypothetical protein
MSESQQFLHQVSELLAQTGLPSQVLGAHNYTRGRNNRTYRIETADGFFIVKKYLRQESDKRNRLQAEYDFLTYANKVAPGLTPKPYYQDPASGLALYEYLEGQPVHGSELSQTDVAQAADFFCALNAPKARLKAEALTSASEACFSLAEHFALIDARLSLLKNLKTESAEDRAAYALIHNLSRSWQELKQQISAKAAENQLDLTASLPAEQRCISPSDFGFHNALKRPDGQVCFLDFEYAGWDDPAKMTGDFFSQLEVPIPAQYFEEFVHRVMRPFEHSEALRLRAQLLRSVYRIKWCCIALNIFLPVHLERYLFANPKLDLAEFKAKQLAKVKALIHSLEN